MNYLCYCYSFVCQNGTSEMFMAQGTELLFKSRTYRSTSVVSLSGICRVIVGILRQKGTYIFYAVKFYWMKRKYVICQAFSGTYNKCNVTILLDLPAQAKVFVYNLIHRKVPGCPTLLLAVAAVWPHPIFKLNYTGNAKCAIT